MHDFIDLHTHSTCSDGTLTPTELVLAAEKEQLAAVALTDHDTTAGLDEAIATGGELEVEVVPGIEVSSQIAGTSIHLLGYGIDHTDNNFQNFVAKLQATRLSRNIEICNKLKKLGIDIDFEELRAIAGDQIGRPHFASLLVQKRIVKSMQGAFHLYLKKGGPAFVELERPGAGDVIESIHAVGGLVFLAHPGALDPSLKKIPSIVQGLTELGLNGLEVYYPTHNTKTTKSLLLLARERNLLLSGGTDFHGANRSVAPLGGSKQTILVPAELWNLLKARL